MFGLFIKNYPVLSFLYDIKQQLVCSHNIYKHLELTPYSKQHLAFSQKSIPLTGQHELPKQLVEHYQYQYPLAENL